MTERGVALVFLILVSLPFPVHADIIHFKGGFAREGIVLERTETEIRLKTELGMVTFPPDVVETINAATDQQNAALEQRWQQEKAKQEATRHRAIRLQREKALGTEPNDGQPVLPESHTVVARGEKPSGSERTQAASLAVNKGSKTEDPLEPIDPQDRMDKSESALLTDGLAEGTDVRYLLENIGIELAGGMAELVERTYPSLQQDLSQLIEDKHPTLESDVVAMISEKYPTAIGDVNRLKASGSREEKVRIIKQLDAQYPALRSDILEVIQRRHASLYGHILELIGRKYPQLLIDLGKKSLNVIASKH